MGLLYLYLLCLCSVYDSEEVRWCFGRMCSRLHGVTQRRSVTFVVTIVTKWYLTWIRVSGRGTCAQRINDPLHPQMSHIEMCKQSEYFQLNSTTSAVCCVVCVFLNNILFLCKSRAKCVATSSKLGSENVRINLRLFTPLSVLVQQSYYYYYHHLLYAGYLYSYSWDKLCP